jgi:hypothetical protein
VRRSVEFVVEWGLGNRDLSGVTALALTNCITGAAKPR